MAACRAIASSQVRAFRRITQSGESSSGPSWMTRTRSSVACWAPGERPCTGKELTTEGRRALFLPPRVQARAYAWRHGLQPPEELRPMGRRRCGVRLRMQRDRGADRRSAFAARFGLEAPFAQKEEDPRDGAASKARLLPGTRTLFYFVAPTVQANWLTRLWITLDHVVSVRHVNCAAIAWG